MKPIQAAWASYAQQCMPVNAPDLQIDEGKLCFMAGASAMFNMTTAAASKMSEEKAMEFLDQLSDELEKFVIDFVTKRAVP